VGGQGSEGAGVSPGTASGREKAGGTGPSGSTAVLCGGAKRKAAAALAGETGTQHSAAGTRPSETRATPGRKGLGDGRPKRLTELQRHCDSDRPAPGNGTLALSNRGWGVSGLFWWFCLVVYF